MLEFRWISVLGVGLVFVVVGCNSGPRQVSVKGNVTFDGQSIDEGSISFLPEAGTESRKASAAIIDGKYEIAADKGPSPGTFKVQISWSKKTGKRIPSADPGMTIDETKEAVPAKYNQDTTLVREITAGDNKVDFVLEP